MSESPVPPSLPDSPAVLAFALLLVLGGGLLWRRQARSLRPLEPADTSSAGLSLWAIAMLVSFGAISLLGSLFEREAGLSTTLLLQALVNLLGIGVMLLVAARRGLPMRVLGLRPQRAGSPALSALGAWLAFLPVFLGVALLSGWIFQALGRELPMQDVLREFLEQPGARGSVVNWLLITAVVPATEELIFRGALYGGLRRLLQPGAAVALGALAFGIMHGTEALLPTAALGVALCLLYERTGSLLAPMLFHALHNGVMLAMVSIITPASPAP